MVVNMLFVNMADEVFIQVTPMSWETEMLALGASLSVCLFRS